MVAFDFPRSLLLVTLCIIALTSSVNAGPDGTDIYAKSRVSRNLNNLRFEQKIRTVRSLKDPGHQTESPVPQRDSSRPINSSTIDYPFDINNEKGSTWMAEGGPIPSSTQHENILTKDAVATKSDKPDESRIRENVPKERNANPSVVARKGVQYKIKPRKGVDQGIETTNMFNQTTYGNTKPVMETNSAIENTHINSQTVTSNSSISKSDANNSRSNNSVDHITNSNYSSIIPTNVTTSHIKMAIINDTTPKVPLHIEKHIPKPKPTVTTVDGPEINESRPSSRTKSSPLGMPRKIDYIVPVITTIVILPILGAAIFVLYKRGRDCWDKRHYRRMDFLIDGMYND